MPELHLVNCWLAEGAQCGACSAPLWLTAIEIHCWSLKTQVNRPKEDPFWGSPLLFILLNNWGYLKIQNNGFQAIWELCRLAKFHCYYSILLTQNNKSGTTELINSITNRLNLRTLQPSKNEMLYSLNIPTKHLGNLSLKIVQQAQWKILESDDSSDFTCIYNPALRLFSRDFCIWQRQISENNWHASCQPLLKMCGQ